MSFIIAVVAFSGMSAVVVVCSLYINRNIALPPSPGHAASNVLDVVLKPTRADFRFSSLARRFLHFRERYDTAWEIGEGVMIATVFVCLFLGYEEEERVFGLISHALVGVLLMIKFASLALAWWGRRHSPGQSLS
jgi:hypothetical protein